MYSQALKLTIQLKAHVIKAAFALKVFLQTNHTYIKKISDQTRRIMNHITFINLDPVATTTSRRNTRNSDSAESIVFSSKWIISRQSVFKKTMIKFETNIENFRQRYFQSKAKTSPSTNNISPNKKLNPSALKLSSRFLKNVYNKFIRDQSQFRFASTNSLNLSSISEIREKQFNISKMINSSSISSVDNSQDRPRSENVISPSTEISVEEIIYDHLIDSQLKNMTPSIEDVVIQTIVNAAINRSLKNMMNKIQEMIFNT